MNSLSDALLYINGEIRGASNGATFDIVNPWTAKPVGKAADATNEDVDAAIVAARTAFDTTDWSTNHAARKELMQRYAKLLRDNYDTLMQIARLEAGAAIGAASRAHVDGALDGFDDLLRCFDEVEFQEDRGVSNYYGFDSARTTFREAAGVVAAITPWNVPLYVNVGKVIGALLAGCTVILKPAPDTPKMGAYMGELAKEAGFPPGVFNVITSEDPARAGEMMVDDPRIDVVSFTGSTGVGKRIMERSAATLKRVFLELGGKSVIIVMDDAPEFATIVASYMLVYHAGQGCAVTSRMLVPRSRYEEACTVLQHAYAAFDKWGDPDDPEHVMGPVISARQKERVMSYIELGKKEGARLIAGGNAPADKGDGFFIEPTCFADVNNDMRIAREEIFGPVLVVIPFDDDEDAIRIANDSTYGLGGAVFSADVERAMHIAKSIRTGTVSINGGVSIKGDIPFGGYKESGIGREWGREGIEEFTEIKTVAMRVS